LKRTHQPIHRNHEKPGWISLIIAFRNAIVTTLQAADRLICAAIISTCARQKHGHSDIIFCTQYYQANKPERQREILECLTYNSNLHWVDSVFLFAESGAAPQAKTASKVRFIPTDNRLSFGDIFSHLINSGLSDDTIIIIANSDIFLDASLPRILEGLSNNDFISLTRYETRHARTPFMAEQFRGRTMSASQDVWIFKAAILKNLPAKDNPGLPLGIPGCENILASFIHRQGVNVVNPCLDIRVIHNHNSEQRSYTEDSRLRGLYAFPCIQTVAQFLCGRRPAPAVCYFDGHEYISFSAWVATTSKKSCKNRLTSKESLASPDSRHIRHLDSRRDKSLHQTLKKQLIALFAHIEFLFAAGPELERTARRKPKFTRQQSNEEKRDGGKSGQLIYFQKELYARKECIQHFSGVTAISSPCRSGSLSQDIHGRELHLFTKHGIPIQHGRPGITLKSIVTRQLRRSEPVQPLEIIENALIAGCHYSDSANYYHFLCDAIPDIWMYINHGGCISDLDAILMPYSGAKWQDEIFQLLSIDINKIKGLHAFDKCLIKSAHISFRAKGGLTSSPMLHHSLSSFFKPDAFEADGSPRKIYASRLGSKRRQLINELELIEFLKNQGYMIISCSKETVSSQIRLFRNADFIIAPHGAALTNIAWCKPGTKVLDIIPVEHANPCFHDLAYQADLEYDYFPSKATVRGLDPIETPVTVDINLLKLKLKHSLFI
jgi:capsular polysaccharide biosynthesis protein